jgi:hypothetical protein
VKLHGNARTCPRSRRLLVKRFAARQNCARDVDTAALLILDRLFGGVLDDWVAIDYAPPPAL